MKKITLLLLVFTALNCFSQNREGTIFYSSVDRTEETYNINIDIFELHGTEYIEVELFDEKEVKLSSNMATLRFKDKKFFLTYNNEESEVVIQNINLKLKNTNNDLEYPMVKVKLLDENYDVVDFSQRVFY
ncbi:hypothetical protein C7447_103128 [Tenacibaculum adriaticum]|uniref:Uncharacterized protein n=1 Tax=Tenacibaculum adriaticum TaxID=413713 RepID=A0A5S5DSX2_9FLAO|nr:hypothetical protein [Tenacibaculum adriaticum]TYP97962.1 hypothetical protein C7447_103128 [Tenacibaculum adriaticum]